MTIKKRSPLKEFIDFITFPIRAFTLFHNDAFGLSSLASERFYYAAKEVKGYNLDVGCGYGNEFTTRFLNGNGKGIDVFKYEGLKDEDIFTDMSNLPFKDASFKSVTYIANINHVPKPQRLSQMKEALRLLEPNGNIIITMASPIAELIVHRVVYVYDKILGTSVDMDSERGMVEGEEYYLTDKEIEGLLTEAGFKNIKKKYFLTQWGLNHLFTAEKIV